MASTSDSASPPAVKITLHWLEMSRSHRILWLFEELNLAYELKTYKRTKEKFADPQLKEIHPLGKAPIVTIEAPGLPRPLVLAESAAIVEYICDHFGKSLIPKRYQDDKEGQVGGETESWLRYRYFMHYAEGSLMSLILVSLLSANIKNAPTPFFIKPITSSISGRITSMYLQPNFQTHYKLLEEQLSTSPDGGEFLCGQQLTGADILMSFPLEAGQTRSGMTQAEFPKLWAYVDRLHQMPSYKRSVEKIEAIEGCFDTTL